MKFFQILGLIFALTVFTNAQKELLSGVVYDGIGAVIPEVKITAVNQKGEQFETSTNAEGFYELTLSYTNKNESPSVLQTNNYEIIFDRTNWGFKKLVIKNYLFVGRMRLDIALGVNNPEPCGVSGADCPAWMYATPIQTVPTKISNKVLQRPLVTMPKKQNKTKRKNKSNK